MDWANERYVRVYTRDTTTWKLMDWRGRCVLQLLMRKVDRAGVLDVGHDGVLGLAAVLELPIEIAEAGIAQLTAGRGGMPTVVDTGTAYVLPNFIEAQEAAQSDPQRKRESRARRRDVALAVSRNILQPSESGHDGHETGRDRDVGSQPVTLIRSVPDPIREDLPPARAIPPTATPAPEPEPEVDEIVQPAPGLVHRPTTATPDEVALEARRRVQLELRAELERERRAVAAEFGVTDHGLLAQDPGERDLAMHLVAAGPLGLAAARAQALHAIAMAGLEARAEPRKFQWLTGAIFSDRNFRRLVGTTAAEASKPPPPTRAARELAQRFGGEASAPARARRKDPPPAIAKGADPAELLELAAAARASLYGANDLARAPPAGAPPTDLDDDQPEPAEAT